uniref:Ribosomal protein S14 n=1 Tax=Plectus sambesii TaxID=2011161 RepID=A0A914WZ65_9BILA
MFMHNRKITRQEFSTIKPSDWERQLAIVVVERPKGVVAAADDRWTKRSRGNTPSRLTGARPIRGANRIGPVSRLRNRSARVSRPRPGNLLIRYSQPAHIRGRQLRSACTLPQCAQYNPGACRRALV